MAKILKFRALIFVAINIVCLWWVFEISYGLTMDKAYVEGRIESATCSARAGRTGTLDISLSKEQYTAGGILLDICQKCASQVGAWAVIEYNKVNNAILDLSIAGEKVIVRKKVVAGSFLFWLLVVLWINIILFRKVFLSPKQEDSSSK